MKNITDYVEKEQVDQVLGAAHQCSTRDYLMLRVLWRTGVRENESFTTTPRDIEPHNSVINVIKAKGGKQRRVHLDAETITMLSNYISEQQLPLMISLYLPSNNDRCEISSSAMGRSSKKTSVPTPSDTHMQFTACETVWISGGCSRRSGIRV
jgi:site-specific recombinase XerD